MGENWKYYDLDAFNGWKRKQGKAYKAPPRANFLAAANYIRAFLDGKKFNWAAMCGLAMLCLGYRRDMHDIHIVYDDRDFNRILSKLESEQRVRLPKGTNPLFPTKILVRTGPAFKDAGCSDNVDIEVDLVPPGSHGAPSNDVLRKNQILLRLNDNGRPANFKGLNMLYQLRTLLVYCRDKNIVWDPRNDILFLCNSYAKDIEHVRSYLDQKALHENFFSTPDYGKLPIDEQRRCSMILLGKEFVRTPPPAMSVTPPLRTDNRVPPMPGNAPNQDPRRPIQSHKSTPNLNNQKPPASMLTPPLPGKMRQSQQSTPHSNPPQLPNRPPPGPQSQVVPIYSTGNANSHRPTSAPNSAPTSRNPSFNGPPVPQCGSSRPKSMDSRAPPKPPTQPMQNVPNPQRISGHGPAPMNTVQPGPAPRKSMPNLASHHASTLNMAEGLTFSPPTKGAPVLPPIPPEYAAAAAAAAAIPASKRNDQRRSSQGALQQPRRNEPAPIRPSIGHQGPPALGSAPLLQQPSHHSINIPVQPLEQKRPRSSEATPSHSSSLRLVGPEGVYAPPPKPAKPHGFPGTQMQGNNVRPVSSHVVPHSTAPGHAFAVELPAVSPTPKPKVDSAHESPNMTPASFQAQHAFIAELPANPTPAPPQTQLPIRPTHPRTTSEPVNALPTSLMIGGIGQRRSPQQSNATVASAPQHVHNNSDYYAVSPPKPNAHPAAHAQTSYTSYQAYSGPISPPTTATAGFHTAPAIAHPGAVELATELSPLVSESPNNLSDSANLEPAPLFSQWQTPDFLPGASAAPRRESHHSPVPASASTTTSAIYSPLYVTDAITKYYQRGDEPRYVDLPPTDTQSPPKSPPKAPPKVITGYEAFAHGPYSAIDTPESAKERQREAYERELAHVNTGNPYANVPVNAEEKKIWSPRAYDGGEYEDEYGYYSNDTQRDFR